MDSTHSPAPAFNASMKTLLVPRAHRARATGLQGVTETKVLLSDVSGAKLLQRDMEAGLRKSQGMGSGNMM